MIIIILFIHYYQVEIFTLCHGKISPHEEEISPIVLIQYLINLNNTKMKKIILASFIIVCSLIVVTPSYSQGYLQVNFQDIAVTISYPDTWELSREHVLLLLMPKNKEFTVEFEAVDNELSTLVRESIEKMLKEFPMDTNIIKKEFVVNEMNVVELSLKTSESIVVNYLFVETPKRKILRMHINAPEEEILKYKNDIKHIKENITQIK